MLKLGMKRMAPLVPIVLFFCNQSGGSGSQERPDNLQCHTSIFMLEDFRSGTKGVSSPDQAKRVTLAKDFTFRVLNSDKEIGRIDFKDLSSNVQIVWAPDSRKFSITYSSGGAIGTFRAHVYRIQREAIIELSKLPESASDDFEKKYYCKMRGNNMSALGWQTDSQAIFLVAEVYPTSDCGKIWQQEAGYLVDMDGNITRHFTKEQTRKIEQECRSRGLTTFPSMR